MIPGRKSRYFNAWFSRDAEARLKRSFSALHVAGLERLTDENGPTLIVSNHTCWWDSLVALVLVERIARRDGYALMDAANLRRLPFFALIGAFGVDLGAADSGAAAISYAAGLLDRPGRVVWVFPQGRERPVTARPLAFKPGAAAIARRAPGAQILPVALRYEHGSVERPAIYVSIGPAIAPGSGPETQEQAVEAELQRIERALGAGPSGPRDHGFATLFARGEGWLSSVMTATLAWMVGRVLRLPPP